MAEQQKVWLLNWPACILACPQLRMCEEFSHEQCVLYLLVLQNTFRHVERKRGKTIETLHQLFLILERLWRNATQHFVFLARFQISYLKIWHYLSCFEYKVLIGSMVFLNLLFTVKTGRGPALNFFFYNRDFLLNNHVKTLSE